jgi:hypothetical protein
MPKQKSRAKPKTEALMMLAEEGHQLGERLVELQIEQDQGGDIGQAIDEIIYSMRKRISMLNPLNAFAFGTGFMCSTLRTQDGQLPARTGWEGFNLDELPDLFAPLAHE